MENSMALDAAPIPNSARLGENRIRFRIYRSRRNSNEPVIDADELLKSLLTAAGLFIAADSSLIFYTGKGHTAVLTVSVLSWLLKLFLILLIILVPNINSARAKIVTGLGAFLTAGAYLAFAATKLESVNRNTVLVTLVPAVVVLIGITIFLSTSRVEYNINMDMEICLVAAPIPNSGISGDLVGDDPALWVTRRIETLARIFGNLGGNRNAVELFKSLLMVAGLIFAADSSLIFYADKGQTGVLTVAVLSWMLMLELIVFIILVPNINYTRAKIVTGLGAVLTAGAYLAFAATKLESVTRNTVSVTLVSAVALIGSVIFLSTSRVEYPSASIEGADLV